MSPFMGYMSNKNVYSLYFEKGIMNGFIGIAEIGACGHRI
jgi:hypothetical protein